MTGPTHKQFAITFAFIAAMIFNSVNFMTFKADTRGVWYYAGLLIMLEFGKKGALFPDVDHDWDYVKEKTVPNRILNILIHLTGGRHRSWQTHSLDLSIIFTCLSYEIPVMLYNKGLISISNKYIIMIVMLGFASGWLSHMFSDMLNGVGIRLFFWCTKKVALVPRKFLGVEFKTGEEWESFCFTTTRIINIVLGVLAIVFPLIKEGVVRIA